MEYVNCPSCGSCSYREWAQEGGFVAVRCEPCGLIYVNPRPGEDEITEANKIGVHRQQDGSILNVSARRVSSKVAHYKNVISDMFAEERASKSKLNWLDLGAGYGEVVEAVQQALPYASVEGIEPMRPKVDVARARGIRVNDTPLANLDSKYDVISLINVYSHIPDFKAFGVQLTERLNPGGLLFMETGNLPDLRTREDFPDILYLPDHLVFAGPQQLKDIASSLGLTMELVKPLRVDNPAWAIKQTLKAYLRGEGRLVFPYTSRFRTIFYRMRKPS